MRVLVISARLNTSYGDKTKLCCVVFFLLFEVGIGRQPGWDVEGDGQEKKFGNRCSEYSGYLDRSAEHTLVFTGCMEMHPSFALPRSSLSTSRSFMSLIR